MTQGITESELKRNRITADIFWQELMEKMKIYINKHLIVTTEIISNDENAILCMVKEISDFNEFSVFFQFSFIQMTRTHS